MTGTPINEKVFSKLVAVLQELGASAKESSTDSPLYQQFLQAFPASSLSALTLEQYCVGKGTNNSFCWWIERGLEPLLGRYMPGTSKGHRLYFQNDGSVYKPQILQNLSDEEALAYTLAIQSVIANVGHGEDWHWIDDDEAIYQRSSVEPKISIAAGRKLRLLSVYQIEEALPISSPAHIGHFLKQLGAKDIPALSKPVARMLALKQYFLLAKQQIPELSVSGFVKGLYSSELNISPKKAQDVDIDDDDDDDYEPMDNKLLEKSALNQIIYGPPGTGKTYETIRAALAIVAPDSVTEYDSGIKRAKTYEEKRTVRLALKTRFNQFHNDNRIRFVTFHQSFSYEDFVEGIRAETGEDSQLKYRIGAGVFKQICDDARTNSIQSIGVRQNPAIWKISINGSGDSPTKRYCLDHNEVRIGWGLTGDLRLNPNDNSYYNSLSENTKGTLGYFSEKIEIGDILLCLHSAEEISSIGVVTSDYRYEQNSDLISELIEDYQHVRSVNWLCRDINLSILPLNDRVTLTQKAVYPLDRFSWADLLSYLRQHNISPLEAGTARQEIEKPFVLIIDEINRGNISRILGDLITLIEPSKREGADEALTVTLPYSKMPFSVPKNVYLIGTMNTVDRSLAGLDLALRRRFTFIEMPPRPELLDDVAVEGLNIGAILRVMNQRIAVLLDRDHCIGHAYFMPLFESNRLPVLRDIFKQKIIPLLQEYFFEDWQRIRWVLNDQNKVFDAAFVVEDQSLSLDTLFQGVDSGLPNRTVWQLNEAAFDNIAAYQGIL